MGRAVEGDEARDIAFASEALAEFFDAGNRDNRVLVAVEKKHGGELAPDVFARASPAGVALVAEILHADAALGGIDNRAPEDQRIGSA